jgi:hypothetical protein
MGRGVVFVTLPNPWGESLTKVRNVTLERLDMTDWKECIDCGDDVPTERYQAFCKFCEQDRERSAGEERLSWCVVQEYGKGNYQLVTPASARTTLKQTNQKELRG